MPCRTISSPGSYALRRQYRWRRSREVWLNATRNHAFHHRKQNVYNPETLDNASRARSWLKSKLDPAANIDAHFAAVTVAVADPLSLAFPRTQHLGSARISVDDIRMVSVGLAISLHLGTSVSNACCGAELIDRHLRTARRKEHSSHHGPTAFWYGTLLGAETRPSSPSANDCRYYLLFTAT